MAPSGGRPPLVLLGGLLVVGLAAAVAVLWPDRGDSGTGAEPPTATTTIAAPEVPSGLTAVESVAGVQLDWQGEPVGAYAVLVMSETTAPKVLPADDGPTLLVPVAELTADVGYCFAVADIAALDAGGGSEAAFSSPTCIRGASEDTIRQR